MTPDQYCKNKLKESHTNFAIPFLFLPKSKKQALIALYAFCREVDDIADECTEYDIGLTKLNWWSSEIENLFNDNPQHLVTKALKVPIEKYNLNKNYFIEIIDGMKMDLDFNRYEDFKQLQLYTYRAASVVGILSAHIFGFNNKKTLDYAHNLGIALQLTNIIRDVGEDIRRNRIYIPLSDLETFKVKEDDFKNYLKNDKIKDLMNYQIKRAKEFYTKAEGQLSQADKFKQLPGLMMGAIYYDLLLQIEDGDLSNILNEKTQLTPVRKLFIILKTIYKTVFYNKNIK
jgi:phytoene synthase